MNGTEAQMNKIRYGSEDPLPERKLLRAGSLSVYLEGTELRYIHAGKTEVVRGIYNAVRDRNWGTITPEITAYQIDEHEKAFKVQFKVKHQSDEIDFIWDGCIVGSEESTLRFEMKGRANRTFYRNRIGFCVLHPAELAGVPVEVETLSGKVLSEFPELISPHQLFTDMMQMCFHIPGERFVEIHLEGDLFETEDQRNWTDANYKTYCTPLRMPYPVEVKEGTEIKQSITVRLGGKETVLVREIPSIQKGADQIIVNCDQAGGDMPQIGLSLPEDVSAAPQLMLLKQLHPNFLRLVVHLCKNDWHRKFHEAVFLTSQIGCELELELITHPKSAELSSLVHLIKELDVKATRVFIFPEQGYDSTRDLLLELRELRQQRGLDFAISGGTRANFAELNRMAIPLDSIDVAGYSINPQLHAFDIASMVETLTAQHTTAKSALQLTDGLPLSIGPITFRPRLNPYATSDAARKKAENPDNQVDNRQHSLFGAGWVLGSISQLAAAGAQFISYLQTSGKLGVMDGNGNVYPTFQILQLVLSFSEGERTEWLPVSGYDPRNYAVLAMLKAGKMRILIANLTNQAQSIRLIVPGIRCAYVWVLDEQGYKSFRSERDNPKCQLMPFASYCFEFK